MTALPGSPPRPRRGFSLVEIGLTLLVLTAFSAALIPTLFSGEQAAAARDAQASVEAVLTAGIEFRDRTGTPPSSRNDLEDLVPRLTLVGTSTASSAPTQISVSFTNGSLAAAATDGEGFCWGAVVPDTDGAPVFAVLDPVECTATALRAAVVSAPSSQGTSWADPFDAS